MNDFTKCLSESNVNTLVPVEKIDILKHEAFDFAQKILSEIVSKPSEMISSNELDKIELDIADFLKKVKDFKENLSKHEDTDSLYKDSESDETYTLAELKTLYVKAKNDGETEAETFEDYLANCTDKNGFLVKIR